MTNDSRLSKAEGKLLGAIGIVHYCQANRSIGGLETSVARLVKQLRLNGRSCEVVVPQSPRKSRPTKTFFQGHGVEPIQHLPRRRHQVAHFHAATLLMWPIRTVLFAYILGNNLWLTVHLPSEPQPRSTRRGRANQLLQLRTRAALIRILRIRCFAPSENAAKQVEERLGQRIAVTTQYNGVYSSPTPIQLPHSRLEAEELSLLFVGRLESHKNPETAIRIAWQLKSRGIACQLRIAGEGSLLRQLQTLVTDLGLTERDVQFLGHLEDTAPLYQDADLLLLPSTHEGCPVVAMEAAAVGVPTAARVNLEGMSEILPDSWLRVRHDGQESEFANTIYNALERHELTPLGEAAWRACNARFSIQIVANKYQQQLEDTCVSLVQPGTSKGAS